jgi:hypothetical protein
MTETAQPKLVPYYNGTMQNFHDFVTRYNQDKDFPDQLRNGLKHTGEHLVRIWIASYQSNQTTNYSFKTNLKALSTRTNKSKSTLKRHIKALTVAGVIAEKGASKMAEFLVTINDKIVQFKEN